MSDQLRTLARHLRRDWSATVSARSRQQIVLTDELAALRRRCTRVEEEHALERARTDAEHRAARADAERRVAVLQRVYSQIWALIDEEGEEGGGGRARDDIRDRSGAAAERLPSAIRSALAEAAHAERRRAEAERARASAEVRDRRELEETEKR